MNIYKFELTIESTDPQVDRVGIIQSILNLFVNKPEIKLTIVQKPIE